MIEVINTDFYPLFCLAKDGGYELNYEVIFWNTIMILKGAAHISQAAKSCGNGGRQFILRYC